MRKSPLLVSLFLTVLPLVLVGVYLSVREYDHQTSVALERRGAIANLGASLIHEKFDGIIDVGTSLASRRLVYQNVEKGEWDEIAKNMERIPEVFPYIDAVTFLDATGVLRVTIPPRPEVIGVNYAYRDYYQGVSKEWKPYVSEAFKRSVEPKDNLVSVAVPVKSTDQKVLGFLLLTIKLDAIVGWSKDIDVGPGGSVFIVDRKGQLIAHNKLSNENNLIDYSSFDSVQKILHGENGVEIHGKDFASDEEHVAAFSPVSGYGFGIEVLQPTRIAFAGRNRQTLELSITLVVIVLAIGYFFYLILRDRALMKKQRDREEAMLESIGDGVVAIDRYWKIILWNKSASVVTGWSKDEALGKPFREIVKFIRESDRKENISFIEDAIVMSRVSSMDDGVLLIKKDGSEVTVGDSAAPIIGLNGEVEGAIIVFRDTSREIESKHLRSDFSYASHQLRTPVTEALWNLETGINEQDAEKKKEDLRVAYQSLLSVKKLSEHLVDVSEIDQGNVAMKLSAVKLLDVFTEIQSKLETEAHSHGVKISIVPVSPLMAINTDQKFLTNILFEVIENAVMYSHRDTNVTVTTTLKEKELLVEVADTGVGIPEEEQVLIFTKFFRGSNRGSENAGDGLGLYLAKEYTTLLGGKIWFESVEGKGTTFFISVPIA